MVHDGEMEPFPTVCFSLTRSNISALHEAVVLWIFTRQDIRINVSKTFRYCVLRLAHLSFSTVMIESTLKYLKNLGDKAPSQDTGNATSKDDLSKMAEFSIDEYRPMKVIVVGAGLTGVAAAIR